MVNYTIYERNDVLQLRINGGKHNHNIRFSLGVKVPNLKFNPDKARCQSTSEAAIKTNILIRDIEECIEKAALLPKDDLTLETLKDQVLSIVKPLNQRIETRNGYLLDCIKEYVNFSEAGGVRSATKRPLSEVTISVYKYFLSLYQRFLANHKDINLHDVSVHGVTELRERRSRVDSVNSHLLNFRNWMIQEGMHPNSQYAHITKVVAVMNWYAAKEVLVIQYEAPSRKQVSDRVFLEPSDVKTILNNYHIRNRLEDSHRYLFDLILFGLTTALRRRDLMQLKVTDFKYVDGKYFLTNMNNKTLIKTMAQVPKFIYDIAVENHNKTGFVVGANPFETNALVSAHLHTVLNQPEFEQLKRLHTKQKLAPDGKSQYPKTDKLYKFVTPHVLRRSAITSMLVAGVDEETVKKMSGHARNSDSFNVYVGHVQSHFDEQSNKYLSFIGS
jgi:integrase